MIVQALSIDPSGLWSLTKARKVLEIINPEAAKQGVVFRAIDITTFNMPHPRVMLHAFCIEHERPIERDAVCKMCLKLSRNGHQH